MTRTVSKTPSQGANSSRAEADMISHCPCWPGAPLLNLGMAYIDTHLKADEIPVGGSRLLDMGELPVGLFHTADGFFALNNVCPHRGAPLHDGMVSDGQVTCPWHQWQFELKDGKCRNIPGARVAAYPVEVREGTLWLDLDDPAERKP